MYASWHYVSNFGKLVRRRTTKFLEMTRIMHIHGSGKIALAL